MKISRAPTMNLISRQNHARVPELEPPLQYHVFICHCGADLSFAIDLLNGIERHGFKCVFAGRNFVPGELITENIITAINRSRRVLMVYSKQTLKSEWCTFEVIMTLEKSLERDRCLFIPVLLADASIEDLPRTFSRVSCIETKDDPDYLNKILYAISVPDSPMESQLPAENVGQALAWSYFYGYLNLILPEIDIRIKDTKWWNNNHRKRKMSSKIFIMLPESCNCFETLTCEDADITHAGCLDDLSIDRAGTVARRYKNTVYKVTYKNEEYFCVCEYASAVLVMHEMEVNRLAGLSSHDRKLQVERFHKTIESILNHGSIKSCKGKARVVRYGKNGPRLSQIMINIIKEEIKNEIRTEKILTNLENYTGCSEFSNIVTTPSVSHKNGLPNNIHVTSNGNIVEKIVDTQITRSICDGLHEEKGNSHAGSFCSEHSLEGSICMSDEKRDSITCVEKNTGTSFSNTQRTRDAENSNRYKCVDRQTSRDNLGNTGCATV